MKGTIQIGKESLNINLSKPLDISIPLRNGNNNPKAWFASDPSFSPVKADNFIGSVKDGGAVNFFNVFFNPHGNGTHTECAGHILPNLLSINDCLKHFWFKSRLISVIPEEIDNDKVITRSCLYKLEDESVDALIIRTLPNSSLKTVTDYSGQNPPYIDPKAMEMIVSKGIKHLLVDLPSVDREKDGGKLKSHHTFWQTKNELRKDSTITEFIFVPDDIPDGLYLLNLLIAPFDLDASPSKPILYEIMI